MVLMDSSEAGLRAAPAEIVALSWAGLEAEASLIGATPMAAQLGLRQLSLTRQLAQPSSEETPGIIPQDNPCFLPCSARTAELYLSTRCGRITLG